MWLYRAPLNATIAALPCAGQGRAAREGRAKMPSRALCPAVRAGNLGKSPVHGGLDYIKADRPLPFPQRQTKHADQ